MCLKYIYFLADRTNGRAYATVLRPSLSSACLWRYVLVNGCKKIRRSHLLKKPNRAVIVFAPLTL